MGVFVQRSSELQIGERKFHILAILFHETDDEKTMVLQAQCKATNQIYYFDMREDCLVDIGEDYKFVAV